jgi:hypothetical protein
MKYLNWRIQMANRTPRELETREKTESRYVYKPASTLPEPAPDPDYDFHWVAVSINGTDNTTNISQKRRDGWVPVKAVDYPELEIGPNKSGEVEIGGLILCKVPKEMNQGRKDFFDKKAQNQMESVDNSFMRQSNPNMPLFAERKSTTTRGRGFGGGEK